MAKINVSSDYEYITNKQAFILESDIPKKVSIIQDNLLRFQADFSNGKWTEMELLRIADELEFMGQYFAEQQGLFDEGNLIRGMHANVVNARGNTPSVQFYNDARNSRGEFYAGHWEYGHRLKDGRFEHARPFMRPALYAVARASQGNFRDILSELLKGAFNVDGSGYQGLNNLNFGHRLRATHARGGQSFILNQMNKKSRLNPNYFVAEHSQEKTSHSWSIRRGTNNKRDISRRQLSGWLDNGRNKEKASYSPKKSKIKYQKLYVQRLNPEALQALRELKESRKKSNN